MGHSLLGDVQYIAETFGLKLWDPKSSEVTIDRAFDTSVLKGVATRAGAIIPSGRLGYL